MDTLTSAKTNTYEVGYRFSRSHTFNEEQVKAFAREAGDDNPLHHDAAYAASTRFGKLIVSGTHSIALLSGVVGSHFGQKGPALGMQFTFELLRPVFADERVVMEWVVTSVQPHHRAGQILELEGALKDDEGRVLVRSRGRVLVNCSFD
jgi:3-hydroxybutyryl-CoA dehydratase